jgi:hypothetical protein
MEGNAADPTVIVREAGVIVLPKGSVAAHVSVTTPTHAPGVVENVEIADPLMRQVPLKPLL